MRLSETDKSAIEARVASFEQSAGAQAVVSVVDRCDSYPEIPGRAFALAAAVTALFVWAIPVSGSLLYHSTTLVLLCVLGAGTVAGLLSVLLPAFGRCLLPAERRSAEVRQYAQALFLTRELFDTRDHTALLILVGLYERRAVILADRGVSARLPDGQLAIAEAQLNVALKHGGLAEAIQNALSALAQSLGPAGTGLAGNELADSVIREQGH